MYKQFCEIFVPVLLISFQQNATTSTKIVGGVMRTTGSEWHGMGASTDNIYIWITWLQVHINNLADIHDSFTYPVVVVIDKCSWLVTYWTGVTKWVIVVKAVAKGQQGHTNLKYGGHPGGRKP